jgi:hypothetical protein
METALKKFLFTTAALSALLFGSAAQATTLDDPLHGYVISGGVDTNTDNGTVSPDAGLSWGFFASPAPQTGTLYLVTVTPDSSPGLSTIGLTGTFTGTETEMATQWTSGTLAAFLGLTSASPPNNCCGSTYGGTATGYDVDVATFNNVTLNDLATSTMSEAYEAGLPDGSLIFAFLVESNGTVDTANSGVILETQQLAATPLPPAAWMFMGGLGLFGWMARKRKTAGAPLPTMA